MLGQNIGLMLANLRLVTKYNSAMSAFVNTQNIFLFCFALAFAVISPVLTLGVHHIYLKASRGEKPTISEMYSKMSQFWSAFFTSLLSAIFVSLQLLLLIIPRIIALYSYSMVYFVLVEHPEFGAMQAIKESKRIMKGHIDGNFSSYKFHLYGGFCCLSSLSVSH